MDMVLYVFRVLVVLLGSSSVLSACYGVCVLSLGVEANGHGPLGFRAVLLVLRVFRVLLRSLCFA